MRSFLLQPYPFSDNTGRKLAFCGGIGLFVAFFLAVFKPFGFDHQPAATAVFHALLFGAVTFAVSAVCQIAVPKLFPALFREEGWRSWKEILFLLLTTAAIGAGNFWLIQLLYPSKTSLGGFLSAQVITFEVGVFPILFVVFLKQLTLYRRFAAAAVAASEEIPAPAANKQIAEARAPEPVAVLRGDNQKEELRLAVGNLICVSSADNYVRVRFWEDDKLKTVMLRATLKKIEDDLQPHPDVFRCHRTYLVNLGRVTAVTGNAQGLKLHLAGLDEALPVSRNLTETVRERLHGLSRSPQTA